MRLNHYLFLYKNFLLDIMVKITRVPTGIDGLDRLLHGGFPLGSTTLLVGAAGTGKSTFCKQFAWEGIREGELAIVLLSGEPVSSFIGTMQGMGWAIEGHKQGIQFVDLYSWRAQASFKDSNPGYNIASPSDLNDLNKEFKGLLEKADGRRVRVIVDSISDALLYNSPQSVFKFMQLFVAQVRHKGATALAVLEGGLHPEDQSNTLEYITDNLIEMKLGGGKRQMRIRKMASTQHPLNWISYTIGKGIEMKVSPIFG